MKKALIAGAASAVLAAMPVVGVFADDITTMTDTLTVTIEASCTFDAASHTYSDTLTANQYVESFGKTTMNVACNNAKGYTVTSAMNDLVGPANAASGNEKIEYSATAVSAAGAGKYSAAATNTINGATGAAAQVSASGTLMTSSVMTPAGGDQSVIVYSVSTTNNQAAGTYTGTAVYTLATNN